MTQWFYQEDGRRRGPVSQEELIDRVRRSEIPADVLVQAEGETGWSRFDEWHYRLVGGPLPDPAPILSAPEGAGWTDTLPHPWRRFFARLVDTAVLGVATVFLLGLPVYFLAPGWLDAWSALEDGPGGRFIDAILMVTAAAPALALLTGLTGGSIGKWIFGIKVLNPEGRPIGVRAALGRELQVWWRGMALGLPFVNLVAWAAGYQGLQKRHHAAWDPPARRIVVHRPHSLPWSIVMTLAVVALAVERAASVILSRMG